MNGDAHRQRRLPYVPPPGRITGDSGRNIGPGDLNAAEADRPNVLLICVDDLRPQLGCYGCEGMVTPNLDRLAAESRVFTRHYVQSAACGPSRCSLLTGKRIVWSWDGCHPRGKLIGRSIRTDRYPIVRWSDAAGKAAQIQRFRRNSELADLDGNRQ